MDGAKNPIESFLFFFYNLVDKPVTVFREKVIEPNQQHYPWYHQKFRRVPTIDECDDGDMLCKFEADTQYTRDKMVDNSILSILRQRAEKCRAYHEIDNHFCDNLEEAYQVAAANWFSKHGDIGVLPNSRAVYMKQKHRMVWERRHGPIGSGMKEEE